MGKIRVRTLGNEKKEKEEKKKAQLRTEAKKQAEEKKTAAAEEKAVVEESAEKAEVEEKAEKKTQKGKKAGSRKKNHSDKYLQVAKEIEKNKKYPLDKALGILTKLKIAKFDETVELHINTLEKGVSGSVTLPHGTGKQIRIAIANQTENPKQVEEIVKSVEGGKIDFDVLIATPDAMPKLARVARFLGPKGLMPNPKNGTVSAKPEETAKKFQGGQINFKTEAKFPIIHIAVGKASFGEKKLDENIRTVLSAVQAKNIKNITLKSTMSPGIKVDSAGL